MPATDFFVPRSLDEAVGLLREHGDDLMVLGGGTILMGMVNDGVIFPKRVMALGRAGLVGVQAVNGHLEIGAGTSIADLSALEELPLLAAAARMVGGPALRTMATLGGNLFAPAPYGDLAVPLLALSAQVALAGPHGQRLLPLDEFLAGRAPLAGVSAELAIAVHVPRFSGRSAYLRMARRHANAPTVVSAAVALTLDTAGRCTAARVAIGGAGPHALRTRGAEDALVGGRIDAGRIAAAAEAAVAASNPLTDAQASAWYRRKMIGLYVRRTLERALADA